MANTTNTTTVQNVRPNLRLCHPAGGGESIRYKIGEIETEIPLTELLPGGGLGIAIGGNIPLVFYTQAGEPVLRDPINAGNYGHAVQYGIDMNVQVFILPSSIRIWIGVVIPTGGGYIALQREYATESAPEVVAAKHFLGGTNNLGIDINPQNLTATVYNGGAITQGMTNTASYVIIWGNPDGGQAVEIIHGGWNNHNRTVADVHTALGGVTKRENFLKTVTFL